MAEQWIIPGFAGRWPSERAALDAIADAKRRAQASDVYSVYSRAYFARMAKQAPRRATPEEHR